MPVLRRNRASAHRHELLRRNVTLFRGKTHMFRRNTAVLRRNMRLLCRNTAVLCRNMRLLRRDTAVLHRNMRLLRRNTAVLQRNMRLLRRDTAVLHGNLKHSPRIAPLKFHILLVPGGEKIRFEYCYIAFVKSCHLKLPNKPRF